MGYLHHYLNQLGTLLRDGSMIEVAINGDGRIWIERAGHTQARPRLDEEAEGTVLLQSLVDLAHRRIEIELAPQARGDDISLHFPGGKDAHAERFCRRYGFHLDHGRGAGKAHGLAQRLPLDYLNAGNEAEEKITQHVAPGKKRRHGQCETVF